jgi:hypothetical protein
MDGQVAEGASKQHAPKRRTRRRVQPRNNDETAGSLMNKESNPAMQNDTQAGSQRKGALTMSTMFIHSTKKQMITFVSTVAVLALMVAWIASTAFARNGQQPATDNSQFVNPLLARTRGFVDTNSSKIDTVAIVIDNGRRILLTGPVECGDGERADLRVTVTQRETGAVAEGHTFVTCTGTPQRWEIDALTQGDQTFEEGPVVGVLAGRTVSRGETTDAHQWLVNITLVKQ